MESSTAAQAGQAPSTAGAVPDLLRRLAEFGAHAAIVPVDGRYAVCGAAARLSLPAANAEQLDRELALVFRSLKAGLPISAIVERCSELAGLEQAVALTKRFRRFVVAAGVDSSLLTLCLSANELPPRSLRAALRPLLGDGPRYLMLPPKSEPSPVEECVWTLIHDPDGLRPRFWPAFPAGTRSRCSLLPGEASRNLFPTFGIATPAGSAWLPVSLDIRAVCDRHGALRDRRFERTLDAVVDLGDRLLDELAWIDPRQAEDAHHNRRLAVNVHGFGDLILERGDDPSDWDTLKWLDRLVARLHAGLWRRSRELAARRGPAPSLAAREPSGRWRDAAHRRAWRDRWRAALVAEQVRHRNLLVLSPYAVLPRSIPPTPEFADLLPALLHADAFCFSSAPRLEHWTVADLRAFYGRLQALIDRHNAASFVAAGV